MRHQSFVNAAPAAQKGCRTLKSLIFAGARSVLGLLSYLTRTMTSTLSVVTLDPPVAVGAGAVHKVDDLFDHKEKQGDDTERRRDRAGIAATGLVDYNAWFGTTYAARDFDDESYGVPRPRPTNPQIGTGNALTSIDANIRRIATKIIGGFRDIVDVFKFGFGPRIVSAAPAAS